MTNSDRQGDMLTALAGCDMDALAFTAEMYGVQLDQLAAVLGVSVERARVVAVRWRGLGLAESARLGPGPPCRGPANAGPSRPNSPTRRSRVRPRSCGRFSPGPETTAVRAPRPPNQASRRGTPGRCTSAPPPPCPR